MAKKPWESKIFDSNKTKEDKTSRADKNGGFLSTPLLTGLLSVFFLIVVGILIFVFYTSNGGSDETQATSGFYQSSTSKAKTSKSSESAAKDEASNLVSETTETTVADETDQSKTSDSAATESSSDTSASSQTAGNGETIVVQAGEGAASIAARAGISVEKLQALNPQHMTLGYWYANPGDQVFVN